MGKCSDLSSFLPSQRGQTSQIWWWGVRVQVCEGSWFHGFGLEAEVKVTTCMGFVLFLWLWLPPECGLQLALALV